MLFASSLVTFALTASMSGVRTGNEDEERRRGDQAYPHRSVHLASPSAHTMVRMTGSRLAARALSDAGSWR